MGYPSSRAILSCTQSCTHALPHASCATSPFMACRSESSIVASSAARAVGIMILDSVTIRAQFTPPVPPSWWFVPPFKVVCPPLMVVCSPFKVFCSPLMVVCSPFMVVCPPLMVVCSPLIDSVMIRVQFTRDSCIASL